MLDDVKTELHRILEGTDLTKRKIRMKIDVTMRSIVKVRGDKMEIE
jgi:hypothetical protein